jgi:hypothetical protein
MLGFIALLLVILWFLGMLSVGTVSSYLPILAIIAGVVLVIRLISGRHAY